MKKRGPTDQTNVASRLLLRFVIAYLPAIPLSWILATRGVADIAPETVGQIEFWLIPLALLGAFLTVSKPYLLLLSFGKGFYDTALLYRVTMLASEGSLGILPWNACFLLILLSLLLFALAAARAQLFSFSSKSRDLRLLCTGSFWLYLFECIFFLALAFSLTVLWPRLMTGAGILQAPF